MLSMMYETSDITDSFISLLENNCCTGPLGGSQCKFLKAKIKLLLIKVNGYYKSEKYLDIVFFGMW